jgi:hypothetical protein
MKAWIAWIATLAFVLVSCTLQGVCDVQTTPTSYCEGTAACACQDPYGNCSPDDRKKCCAGRLIDPNTWESGPISSNWLPFAGQYYWGMHLRDVKTGALLPVDRISDITVYVASYINGSDSTIAAGNLGEAQVCTDASKCTVGTVVVRNDTCASYFVRVVVHASPAPVDAGGQ